MPRSIFFSFHYSDDIWRVNQVRNSWVTKDKTKESFRDKAEWEKVKRKGTVAVRNWIDQQLKGTSVTIVLIGTKTSKRPYVNYEINHSIIKGNGLIGIRIHDIKDNDGKTSTKGENPLDNFTVKSTGIASLFVDKTKASTRFKTYNWIGDNGYKHITNWIEEAAQEASRTSI